MISLFAILVPQLMGWACAWLGPGYEMPSALYPKMIGASPIFEKSPLSAALLRGARNFLALGLRMAIYGPLRPGSPPIASWPKTRARRES